MGIDVWPKKLVPGSRVAIEMECIVLPPLNFTEGVREGDARFLFANRWCMLVRCPFINSGAPSILPADFVTEVLKIGDKK